MAVGFRRCQLALIFWATLGGESRFLEVSEERASRCPPSPFSARPPSTPGWPLYSWRNRGGGWAVAPRAFKGEGPRSRRLAPSAPPRSSPVFCVCRGGRAPSRTGRPCCSTRSSKGNSPASRSTVGRCVSFFRRRAAWRSCGRARAEGRELRGSRKRWKGRGRSGWRPR